MSYDIIEHTRVTNQLLADNQSFVVITLLEIRGSAPQVAGAKAIVTENGIVAGTIGGGKVEAAAIDHAKFELANSQSHHGSSTQLVNWNLQTDIGMTCGGEVKIFFEYNRNDVWPIAVFGAGHIAQSLIPLLTQLYCRVTCIDPRTDWLARLADHPKLKKICDPHPETMVEELPAETFFVLVSKGHATDLPVLKQILANRKAPYIGVIGSNQKASKLRRELLAAGIPEEKTKSFFCPMGLPIGKNVTSEIAISIASQLLQVRDQLSLAK